MNTDRATWPLVIMAGLIGVFALLTGSTAERLLGGLALAVAAGLAWTALRSRRSESDHSTDQNLEFQTPELSLGERLLPWLFYSAAILIVVVMVAFTLWYLGVL